MQEVGASCTIESTNAEGKGAFRSAVLANVDGEYRLLVQTQRGWFGRTVVSQGAAEAVRVDFVSITDRVFDKGDDLYVELTQTENSSSTTFAMLCVATTAKCSATARTGPSSATVASRARFRTSSASRPTIRRR